MGQILSHPIIDKEHHSGEDSLTAFGLCAMQGWRMSMEDAHIVETNVLPETTSRDHIALYSIFDGHGGSGVAQFAGQKVASILARQQSFKEGKLAQALIDAYLATDEEIALDPVLKNDHSGCTATSIVVSKLQKKLVCANSGDSRTVLCTKGSSKPMSFDHKPVLLSEKSRIMAADGFVEMDRVNGNLALSRALGDFEFKSNDSLGPHEQIVTCVPDIIEHNLDYENDEFVILACDGIWDCLTSQECCDLVLYGINRGDMTLNDIASRIIDVCCSPTTEGPGIGCDNMSITIVALLKDGESVEQWFQRIREKNYDRPISFELKRRVIYSYYDFAGDDESNIFEITTKKPQERFHESSIGTSGYSDGNNDDGMEVDDTDADVDNEGGEPGHKRGSGPAIISTFPLEAILGNSITLAQGPDNTSYITGNLNEMLSTLRSRYSSGVSRKEDDKMDTEEDEKEREEQKLEQDEDEDRDQN